MKKHFVFLFVIAVLIILFGSGNIFAQSPAWAPEPGTMAYIEWLMVTQGHPYSSYFGGSSPGSGDWFYNMDSPSGFGD